jgi:hypothetical protein
MSRLDAAHTGQAADIIRAADDEDVRVIFPEWVRPGGKERGEILASRLASLWAGVRTASRVLALA